MTPSPVNPVLRASVTSLPVVPIPGTPKEDSFPKWFPGPPLVLYPSGVEDSSRVNLYKPLCVRGELCLDPPYWGIRLGVLCPFQDQSREDLSPPERTCLQPRDLSRPVSISSRPEGVCVHTPRLAMICADTPNTRGDL